MERHRVQKKKSLAIGLYLGIAAIALTVVGIASTAQAAPVLSFGAGSAVTTVDRFTNFDTIMQGQNLSAFSDNGLTVARAGNALCQVDLCGSSPGFSGMSGGIHYAGTGGLFLSIATTDAARIFGLEFNIGTGFGGANKNGYFEIFTNSVLVGSGSFVVPGFPTIVGFSDSAGFDELRLGMFSGSTPVTAFGPGNAIAIDNLSAQLTATALPEPGTFALFVIGLAGLGASRRRRRAAT